MCLAAVSAIRSQPQAQAACPNPPVVSVTSSAVPADVCIPAGFTDNPIAFFDDFSWKSFVAMVWPVTQGQRGMPDMAKKVSDPGTRVFETLKNDWEVFRPDGAAPSDWNVVDQANPCGNGPVGFNDVVLASFSKFGNLGLAGFGDLVHALPAQNRTWTRYQTGFNRVEYDQIVQDKLYLRASLTKPPTFRNGAINVKAAWIDMTNVAHPERYYTRTALTFDPVSQACSPKTVGLVGFHIIQKTPTRPQWLWSTFEQVDNVPPPSGNTAFAYNDGSGAPMPPSDPNGDFPPADWASPKPYNVVRVKPIHDSTQATNTAYQKAIGGPWQYYKLVLTQWPLKKDPNKPIPPSQDGTAKNTFPGFGTDSTSFANTVLETWDQSKVAFGCMACHTATQKETDFVWAVEVHAFPPVSSLTTDSLRAKARPKAAVKLPPALQRLHAILEEAKKNPPKK
jgi:hypothetical protein